MEKITVQVNGNNMTCQNGLSLQAYIGHLRDELGLSPDTPLVAELNGEIVPQDKWARASLGAGDSLEIVHFVGGG